MKRFITVIVSFFCTSAFSQKVGINVANPSMTLHVNSGDSAALLLSNYQPFSDSAKTAMYFKTGNLFTGAIKTHVENASSLFARLGLFTFAGGADGLKERMSILDDGSVGIGTVSPNASLHIVGDIKIIDGTQGSNKILTSDATGRGSWQVAPQPVGVMFGVNQAAGFSLPSGVKTQVTFTSENYDPGNNFSTGAFTVPVTGIYHFDADIVSAGAPIPTAGTSAIEIWVNSTIVRRVDREFSAGDILPSMAISCDLSLTAGNTVKVYGYQFNNGGTTILIGGAAGERNPHFTGHKIF